MAARPAAADDTNWLDRFHAGERALLEECYRNYFRVVETAVGQVLRGADKETVIHDVFLQLLAREELRRGFTGGSFAAWLATIARHQAIDFWRRYRRERSLDELSSANNPGEPVQSAEPFERTVRSAPADRSLSPRGPAGQVGARLRGAVPVRAGSTKRGGPDWRPPDDAGLSGDSDPPALAAVFVGTRRGKKK